MLRSSLNSSFLSSRALLRSAAGQVRTRQYSSEQTRDTAKEAATDTFSEGTADGKSSKDNSESPETTGISAAPDANATKLQELEKSLAEMKDKYIRQVAEYRNLQTRTVRDVAGAKDFAIQKFAKDLIDSVDNLERALETVPPESREDKSKNADLVSLYGGLKMTESILLKTLERHGLKKFTGMGEKFNPNLHEVLYEAPIPDKEPGTIMQVQSTGYTLNGRTIRAAKVGVVKGADN
ncbi:GrpE protein homolog [Taphrina deformans PYCC 5710]|uniref:GrpE protein homolog n=1 Tax=Taphrina deformans (strain PYCC 5710 / ATCC 11124 / CBS 356.35 / IMI 108563 / JCM 9778 / NBRC 8474) TaxID=1097556 RepID=R4X917_TAPDE|nr:GrpE protein homolog [Taphrina deformans PYCC 5710]|eukprot:CCG80647.1 GrpE protein homolog [Taphrina deformans PYCC 5710]